MVSYDHFRHALLAEFRRAESEGRMNLTVNAIEFCDSLRNGRRNLDLCCQAMNDEMKPGDDLEEERGRGNGLTVRYQLPRSAAATSIKTGGGSG